jgi:hypothetical protein
MMDQAWVEPARHRAEVKRCAELLEFEACEASEATEKGA